VKKASGATRQAPANAAEIRSVALLGAIDKRIAELELLREFITRGRAALTAEKLFKSNHVGSGAANE